MNLTNNILDHKHSYALACEEINIGTGALMVTGYCTLEILSAYKLLFFRPIFYWAY